MRKVRSLGLAFLAGSLWCFGSAQTLCAQAPDSTAGNARALDSAIGKALGEIIKEGADLFNNRGDSAGCYRVFEAGLITVRPFLAHRPELQKRIDGAIAEARQQRTVVGRAFTLRSALGDVRKSLELSPAQDQGVRIEIAKDHVNFLAGKELVGRYQIGKDFAKPIFWPLFAPGGVRVTRSWPMEEAKSGESKDHPHQQSAWFCHGDVIPEGIEVKDKIRGIEGVDFWSIAKGHGWIVCTKVGKPQVNGSNGSLATHNEWRTADGIKIMDESRRIFFYSLGNARLLVFDIDLAASVCPITFGDTKEGAMGIRINDQIVEEARIDGKNVHGKGTIQNAEGKLKEKGCWGRISAWCDYSGSIDGKIVGLTILCDPKNPLPSCWHSRGYGLMAANPFGRTKAAFPAVKGRTDLVRLDKGQHLRLRYGILVHDGNAEAGRVAEHYEQFVKLRKAE